MGVSCGKLGSLQIKAHVGLQKLVFIWIFFFIIKLLHCKGILLHNFIDLQQN